VQLPQSRTTPQEIVIESSRLGRIELPASQLIHFPQGLLGFPQHRHYVILVHKPNSPFLWLQSAEDEGLAFVIMDPRLVMPGYSVPLSGEDRRHLEVGDADQVAVYGIITIPRCNPEAMTINLLGPVVINPRSRLGKQVVLNTSSYSHQHPILGPTLKDNGCPASP